MRRDNQVNPKEAKRIARERYAERQIAKWVKWSFETKGKVKYKELLETIDFYKNNEQASR